MDSDKLKKDFKKWSFEMKMRNIFFKTLLSGWLFYITVPWDFK